MALFNCILYANIRKIQNIPTSKIALQCTLNFWALTGLIANEEKQIMENY